MGQVCAFGTVPTYFLYQPTHTTSTNTGTALGDGIEINAATAALMRDRTSPLVLSASKTAVAHAEPAAAINSLLHAMRTLANHEQVPLLHLRNLSSHIDQALRAAPTSAVVPRQYAPLPVSALQPMHVGVSSFAYSGSNAHAVLSSNTQHNMVLSAAASRVAWNKQPLWCVTPPGPWSLMSIHAHQSLVTLQAKLPIAVAASFVSTTPLFVWSALWSEMLSDACSVVTSNSADHLVLTDVAVHVDALPVLHTLYELDIDIASGSVEVRADNTCMLKANAVACAGRMQEMVSHALLAVASTTSIKGPCTAMLYDPEPVDLFTHRHTVAGCQLVSLLGSCATHHVLSTWAALAKQGETCSTTAAMGDYVVVDGRASIQASVEAIKQPPPARLLYHVEHQVIAGVLLAWRFCMLYRIEYTGGVFSTHRCQDVSFARRLRARYSHACSCPSAPSRCGHTCHCQLPSVCHPHTATPKHDAWALGFCST